MLLEDRMKKRLVQNFCNHQSDKSKLFGLPRHSVPRNDERAGFTLAEILITLGVIGIVATLTIPNLITNYQKQHTVEQLKATYSILNNALNTAKVENGTNVSNWYIPNDSDSSASTYFAENYILPYLKTLNICGTNTSGNCDHKVGYLSNKTLSNKYYFSISGSAYSFTLLNGTIARVSLHTITGNTVAKCRVQIFLDINGKQQPNIMGNDAFIIELGGATGQGDRNKFLPYYFQSSSNRTVYFGDTSSSNISLFCNKINGSGADCFALIMRDGWKISDDYPWN